MALTLDNIRQLYNLQKASDKEVMEFAKANNIEISLSGFKNTANLNDLKGNAGGSVFGFNNKQSAQQKTPVTFTPKTNFNFGNTPKFSANPPSLNQNTSIFGNGFGGGNSNTPSLSQTQNVGQLASASGALGKDYAADFKKTHSNWFKNMNFNFAKVSNDTVDSFLTEQFAKGDEIKSKFAGKITDPEMSRVVSVKYNEQTGEIIKIHDDGSEHKEQMTAEQLKMYQGISKKYKLVSSEYVDGRVIEHMANGKTREREAFFGERGYQKDGNSVDEELQNAFPEDYSNIKTDDDRKTLMARYIKENMKNMSSEERERKIDELLKNTDRSSTSGIYLMSIAGGLSRAARKHANSRIITSRDSVDAQVTTAQAAITQGISERGLTSEDQAQAIRDAEELADDFGQGTHYAQTVGSNIATISADNMEQAGMSAMKRDASTFSRTATEAIESTKSTHEVLIEALDGNKELADKVENELADKLFEQTGLKGGKIQNISTDSNGVTKAQVCAVSGCAEIEFDLLNGDTQAALKKFAKLNMATVSDEQKAGLSRVARQSISTVKPEERQAVAHLGVTSETSIQDAKVQAQVITERYEGFEELPEDARKAYLSEQGKQGYKYQEENQLMADDLGRKHDVDDIYNITNADFVQMYENAKIQQEIAQRTVDSGNEDAMTNLANHAYELDPDNVEDIVKMLKEQGSDKTKQALEEAKTRYEEQAQRDKEIAEAKKAETERAKTAQAETEKAKSQAQQPTKNTQTVAQSSGQQVKARTNFSNVSILKAISTKEFKEKSIAEKKEVFKQLNTRERAQAIGEMVETTDATSLKNMMYSSFKTDILKYLVQHSNAKNNQKLKYVERFLSPTDKKMLEEMQEQHKKNKLIL
ncbi:MAG: hypothetical protein DKM24_06335 [Candidatus Melainabacteria bacterium]|nr:MAG: hypothetical protein DKM24_06335 [Candidatus Melainabacteria bacterium]